MCEHSVKRACFNVGIGRELYSAPFIFINVPVEEIVNRQTGKKTYKQKNPYEKWHVVDIQANVEKEKIEYLKIANDKNEVVFLWGKKTAQEDKSKKETPSTPKQEEPDVISEPQRKRLFAIADGNVEAVKRLVKKRGYTSTTEIKKSEYTDICEELKDMLMIDKEEN